MNNPIRFLAFLSFVAVSAVLETKVGAQSPAPVIVQAATSTSTATAKSQPAAAGADLQAMAAAINALQEIKAANDEVLAKQKAALEKLDELHEAAEQLQIFAKRG